MKTRHPEGALVRQLFGEKRPKDLYYRFFVPRLRSVLTLSLSNWFVALSKAKGLLRMTVVVILMLAVSIVCGNTYAQEEKPDFSEPIPPVNIDKTENVEELDVVATPETEVVSPPSVEEVKTIVGEDKPGRPEIPKKREMDTNYDGRVDRIEVYDSEGRVARLDVDIDYDGIFEEWMIFEKGKPKIKGKDRNKDGRTDTWIEY